MKKVSFFLKCDILHEDNFVAHLLCHVTYVTYFNKCSDPDVKLANLWFLITLGRQSQKCKISTSVQYFHYIVSSIIDIKIGYIKLGGGLSNGSYKTIYLR